MNKFQKELLKKCKHVKIDEKMPFLDDIYILPTNKKHDSGYKIMYIVGQNRKNNEYYLLDTMSDVVNFGGLDKYIRNLNVDILDNGIIHFWSNYQKMIVPVRVSNCFIEFYDYERYEYGVY